MAIALRDKTLTDIADAELRAPNDGVILTRARARARAPGAIVQAGDTVLTLTINRPMRVRAYIDEADLSRISPNMAVEVRADGVAKAYHGTIGFISPLRRAANRPLGFAHTLDEPLRAAFRTSSRWAWVAILLAIRLVYT